MHTGKCTTVKQTRKYVSLICCLQDVLKAYLESNLETYLAFKK